MSRNRSTEENTALEKKSCFVQVSENSPVKKQNQPSEKSRPFKPGPPPFFGVCEALSRFFARELWLHELDEVIGFHFNPACTKPNQKTSCIDSQQDEGSRHKESCSGKGGPIRLILHPINMLYFIPHALA